ncbi:TPA: ribosome-associated translation inhibitor RaiA [Candidatus Taylorbacteria bacterium]|nr:ribosome-associated translation inhibitor RaiA [Candidatus Taylorbacteria bacterium]
MNIRTTTHGIELTDSISTYIEKKLVTIERLLKDTPPETLVEVEIEKDNKHRKGQGFKAQINIFLPNKRLFAAAEHDDLYTAIDQVKDEILGELKKQNVKRRDVVRRGAAKAKQLFQQFGSYFIPRRKSK